MNKIRQYFNTLEITRGLGIALLGSGFIYLNYWGFSFALLNTILAFSSLFLLFQSNIKTWFWSGFFTGFLWFWWIGISFLHYEMPWAIPLVILFVSISYGTIFLFIAWSSHKISTVLSLPDTLTPLILKALGLLTLSYIHPFNFDWYKPELAFIESYLGIEKWQYSLILLSLILTLYKKNIIFLFLVILAYQPTIQSSIENKDIALITTHITVKDKWDTSLHATQYQKIFHTIDHAIAEHKSLIILPESIFPVYLNRSVKLIDTLQKKAQNISIVTGGLYWDGTTPRNSTYIFSQGKILVANKVLLVPFGESNPLPDFLSTWVNKIFYDGAVDYKASSDVIDYTIDKINYRNAICFEATSEKLYEKNKQGNRPDNMIVLSNNGWFTPSTEPTLQKLLLQFYSKKYGTTIYHSANMSASYIVKKGITLKTIPNP